MSLRPSIIVTISSLVRVGLVEVPFPGAFSTLAVGSVSMSSYLKAHLSIALQTLHAPGVTSLSYNHWSSLRGVMSQSSTFPNAGSIQFLQTLLYDSSVIFLNFVLHLGHQICSLKSFNNMFDRLQSHTSLYAAYMVRLRVGVILLSRPTPRRVIWCFIFDWQVQALLQTDGARAGRMGPEAPSFASKPIGSGGVDQGR